MEVQDAYKDDQENQIVNNNVSDSLETDSSKLIQAKSVARQNLTQDANWGEEEANKILSQLSGKDLNFSNQSDLTPKGRELYNALKQYNQYGVTKLINRIPQQFLKGFIDALLDLDLNKDNFTSKIGGIRGMGLMGYNFLIHGISEAQFKKLVPYLNDEIEITQSSIENMLKNITAIELLETGDGILFTEVHENRSRISDAAVILFKAKLIELYGKEGYDGSKLTNFKDADGKRIFTTVTAAGKEMEFYFGP